MNFISISKLDVVSDFTPGHKLLQFISVEVSIPSSDPIKGVTGRCSRKVVDKIILLDSMPQRFDQGFTSEILAHRLGLHLIPRRNGKIKILP